VSAQPDSGQTADQVATVLALQSLVTANGDGRAALTDNLVATIADIVRSFTGWYDDLAVRRMAKAIAGQVRPVQSLVAAQESAYLGQAATLMSDRVIRPSRLLTPTQVDDLRVGVNPDDVYVRLANQYRYERAKDSPPPDTTILSHVETRADVMAQTDVALAARGQWEKFFKENKITGYRRIIHPELSKGGTCGLCIAASDRIYHSDRLMPLHARCACGVLPVIGGFDAGSGLNNLSLGDLYGDAAGDSKRSGTSAADLKRTRYAVHAHGELGPVLTAEGDAFRGPADVAAAA
jgi:hypothetical protein